VCAEPAACTIVDVSSLNGVEGGDTLPCSGVTLAAGVTCNLKVSDGYTGAAGSTLVNDCNARGVLTAATVAAQTGCAEDYYQASGNGADNGVCTACAGTTILAAAAFGGAATTCAEPATSAASSVRLSAISTAFAASAAAAALM